MNSKSQKTVISSQTLEELTGQLHIEGCQKLQISFKQNKVTAGCVYRSRSYGSRGTTLTEAIEGLLIRIREPVRV